MCICVLCMCKVNLNLAVNVYLCMGILTNRYSLKGLDHTITEF